MYANKIFKKKQGTGIERKMIQIILGEWLKWYSMHAYCAGGPEFNSTTMW
jgi:hypothetical protein